MALWLVYPCTLRIASRLQSTKISRAKRKGSRRSVNFSSHFSLTLPRSASSRFCRACNPRISARRTAVQLSRKTFPPPESVANIPAESERFSLVTFGIFSPDYIRGNFNVLVARGENGWKLLRRRGLMRKTRRCVRECRSVDLVVYCHVVEYCFPSGSVPFNLLSYIHFALSILRRLESSDFQFHTNYFIFLTIFFFNKNK